MNEINKHNASELLTLYVDGELDNNSRTALFSELSINSDLQNELGEHLAIREAVRNDSEAFTPTLAATGAVFNRLGFKAPAEADIASRPKPFPLFKRIWPPVAAAIIASFITFGLLYNNDPGAGNGTALTAKTIEYTVLQNSLINNSSLKENNAGGEIPRIVSTETESRVNRRAKASGKNYFNIPDKPATENTAKEPEQAIVSSDADICLLSHSDINENINISEELSNSNPGFRVFDYGTTTFANNGRNSGREELTLYIRGLSSVSFQETNAANPESNLFNNMSAGLLLTLFDEGSFVNKLMVGLEFGQETYVQNFIHQFPDKAYPMTVEQSPNFYWYGVAVRGEFGEIPSLKYSEPFLQLMVGGTETGPLLKAIGGLQYEINNDFNMFIGLEGSTLRFKNQTKWFSSEKIGFTYGMSVNF